MAHRLERTDHPAANIAAPRQQPAVLVDSGANETIRPWGETINETGCKKTSVVTASGDRVPALRTTDGELRIKSSGESCDWLLSVRRLVEAGGTFGWTQNGAEVAFRDHEGREQHIKRHIVNGRSQRPSCETCSVEELYRTLWEEETYRISVAERQDVIESEAWAKELLGKPSVTFSEVWERVQKAGLRGQRTRSSLTYPLRLALAIDSTLKPHRDLANAVNSRAGIVGTSEFQGGRLWVEHPDGTIKRRISADKVKVGKLLDVCQQAQIFDPRQWHGADKHQGVRATVSAYTARQLYNLDRDLIEELRTLEFSLPDSGSTVSASRAAAAEAPALTFYPTYHQQSLSKPHNQQARILPKPKLMMMMR
ncbi:GIP [Symbiodinium pilosum]|uniref:GIP protein n=1 Tax=Symbiodinium pilosum TaxID=2952 RepID=A0A812J5W9_SYMPI|nr:GIP [Symbiodinium pilosum]